MSNESRAENPVPVDTFWRSELQSLPLDNEDAEAKGNRGLLKRHTHQDGRRNRAEAS